MGAIRPVDLSVVNLVLHYETLQKAFEKHQERKHREYLPQAPAHIERDLLRLSARGGVPALLEERSKGKHTHQLILYVYPGYRLGALPTNRGDAYRITFVQPISLHDHDRVAKGALQLRASVWELYEHESELARSNRGTQGVGDSNRWDLIIAAWQSLQAHKQQEAPPPMGELTIRHENYLRAVRMLIDVTRGFEQERKKLTGEVSYSRITAAAEKVIANRDTYTFHLYKRFPFSERERLCLKDKVSMQGGIVTLEGKALTMKFDEPIDFDDIPQPGSLVLATDDRVYRIQQRAVGLLEKREAKSRHLLHVLVDQQYQSYTPSSASPTEKLDEQQLSAFRKALTVPDLLLVLGPPGTGKTRTITEIAKACSDKRQRVLITSKTNRAVDNVLERLPTDKLIVIRVGHEDRISTSTQHMLIEEQARKLQEKTLQKTEVLADRLATVSQGASLFDLRFRHLDLSIGTLEMKERSIAYAKREVRRLEGEVTRPFLPKLREGTNWLGHLEGWIRERQALLTRRSHALLTFQQKYQNSAIGSFLVPFVSCFHLYLRVLQRGLEKTQTQFEVARRGREVLERSMQERLRGDPAYQSASNMFHEHTREYGPLQQNTHKLLMELHDMLRGFLTFQAPLAQDIHAFSAKNFQGNYRQTWEVLEQRSHLLKEWRGILKQADAGLHPELLQYADVVGATCIGIATAKGMRDVEFDIAIVDEAGQICLPDLLVPLVRAERVVLVGDHKQLPPYVDTEVLPWLETITPQEWQEYGVFDEEMDTAWIGEILTRSTFEQLFVRDKGQKAHVESFVSQHRMPEVVAEFASQSFYEKQLKTAQQKVLSHRDPLFHSAFAFIDVPGPHNEASYEDGSDPEALGNKGYYNKKEAELIVEMVMVYEEQDLEWIVIVPYQAQARLLRDLLKERGGAVFQPKQLNERVTTVDSFQGGECQRVFYGFTRSNRAGKIGFMKELRCLNVAMTRAQEQLILVGDLATLTHARDEGFRQLARSLHEYTRNNGELLTVEQCRQRIVTARSQEVK